MSKRVLTVAMALAVLVMVSPLARASAAGTDYMPGQLLVKFKTSATAGDQTSLNATMGAEPFKVFDFIGVTALRLNDQSDLDGVLRRYQNNPMVEYAEKVPIYRFNATFPNDPGFPYQWGLHNDVDFDIDAPEVWDFFTGNDELVVAVVDTGVDYTHPDLAANVWTNPGEDAWADPLDPTTGNGIDDDGNGKIDDWKGWDSSGEGMFVPEPDNDPRDSVGHGTHIAGVIGAVGDNGLGVTGVNWNAKIMCVKVSGASLLLNLIAALDGLYYAIEHGAQVISLSWGGPQYTQALKDAMDYANMQGIIVAAGAGNFGTDNDAMPFFPAAFGTPNILSVAASGPAGTLTDFSNYGRLTVDLAAPGEGIYSTFPTYDVVLTQPPESYPKYFATLDGTSMATPYVAGIAALVWQARPSWEACEVIGHILANTTPVPGSETKTLTGGMINIYDAIVGLDVDTDSDGVEDGCDNCDRRANPAQTDADLDGWGTECDCDDTNRNANPGMRERPRDGVDNDCDGEIDEAGCGTYPVQAKTSLDRIAFFLPFMLPLALFTWLRRSARR